MSGWFYVSVDGRLLDGWKSGRKGRWTDRQVDRWSDGSVDEGMKV